MNGNAARFLLSALVITAGLCSVFAPPGGASGGAQYLYRLSNFSGAIPYNWVKVHVSRKFNEIAVYDLSERSVRIFDENGMEIFEILLDEKWGYVTDVVTDQEGNLVHLSTDPSRKTSFLIHCDYRGEFLSKTEITGIPAKIAGRFLPQEMKYRNGKFYLADKSSMIVVVADPSGACREIYDLGEILRMKEKSVANTGIAGFNVDGEGNLFFTIPTLFQAYRVSPERKVVAFGERGSTPGKFNIAGGIATDDFGNCFVADTLRSVVMVFDREFRFLFEFGYMGDAQENLLLPKDLVEGPAGKVFITQAGSRGVSVYRVNLN